MQDSVYTTTKPEEVKRILERQGFVIDATGGIPVYAQGTITLFVHVESVSLDDAEGLTHLTIEGRDGQMHGIVPRDAGLVETLFGALSNVKVRRSHVDPVAASEYVTALKTS